MIERLMIASSAAALAAALAGPASAQMYPDAAFAPLTPGGDWTGTYVGGQVGWGWTSGDATIEVGGDTFDTDVEGSGGMYGLTLGYRHDLGQFVVGGEAQFDWSQTDYDEVNVGGQDVDEVGELKDMWRFKGIAGYDAGRTLVFGSLGWARASIKTPNDTFDGQGWVIGAGADYLLTDRFTLGGELMYQSFSDVGNGTESFDVGATRLQARATFRF